MSVRGRMEFVEAVTHVARTITDCARRRSTGVAALAIGGGSQSGKSYFATTVAAILEQSGIATILLPLSAYYREEALLRSRQGAEEGRELAREELDFDRPSAFDLAGVATDVRRLLDGQPVQLRRYVYRPDPAASGFPQGSCVDAGEVRANSPTVVLVDGLFAHHAPVSEAVDLVVVLVRPDVTKRRQSRIARDVAERGYTLELATRRWEEFVEPGYNRDVCPPEFESRFVIDLVIDNDC